VSAGNSVVITDNIYLIFILMLNEKIAVEGIIFRQTIAV